MPRDQSFRSFHIAIRDRAHDFNDVMRRQIDLHDGAGFRQPIGVVRDMPVSRRGRVTKAC